MRPRGVLELRALPFGPAGGEAGVGWAERERWFALEPSTLAALPCGFMGDETTRSSARHGAARAAGAAAPWWCPGQHALLLYMHPSKTSC